MKKIIAAISLYLGVLGFISAQKISSAEISFNKLDREDAFIVSPALRFDFNNHGWSVGPALLLSFGDQIEERETLKITGLAIGYEHFPHGRESTWNMFHTFDFVAQRIKDVQNSQIFDTSSGTFVSNTIEQIDNNLFLSGNAGVLWKLNERLSLTQTIGIGANVVFRNTTSDFDNFNDVFLSQQWSLKTGIRYSF